MNRPERLSALDASFLFLESRTAPSHGVFLSILDGAIDFDRFRSELEWKLPHLPRFRQVLQHVPFNFAHPSWVNAPDFALDDHLHHVQLSPPATEQDAHTLSLDVFHRGFDMKKPLWSIYIINGIEGDRSAIINMGHHCTADGAADAIMTDVLFDRTPVAAPIHQAPPTQAPPAAGRLQSILHALFDNTVDAAALLKRTPKSVVRNVRALASPGFREGYAVVREFNRAPALRFPFSGPPSGKVDLSKGSLEFRYIRQIRNRFGGTINDVLLAAVTGGLQSYAAECGLNTAGKFFKYQMPANVRMPDQSGEMGNFAAPVPVLVPLDIDDPGERLRAIVEWTSRVKRLKLAMGFHHAIQIAQTMLTPPGLCLVEKLYGNPTLRRLEAALQRTPGTNMFVTNVPRPQVPLYAAGRKILTRHVVVPLLPNQRMVCGAVTYDQRLEISFTGDATVKPGVDTLMRYTMEAFEGLVESSHQAPAPSSDSPEVSASVERFG